MLSFSLGSVFHVWSSAYSSFSAEISCTEEVVAVTSGHLLFAQKCSDIPSFVITGGPDGGFHFVDPYF